MGLVQDDIRREAVTMSLTNHPNLVKAHCSFAVDQSVWVVMPYMSGGSCLHIMKSNFQEGLEEPVIATVLKESLKALEYLHRQGLIHRDVKVSNSAPFINCSPTLPLHNLQAFHGHTKVEREFSL